MEHYAGIDVSLESASICVVDPTGRVVREAKVASEPEVLIEWFGGLGFAVARIGLEAGPLSQWLYAGMRDAGLPVFGRSGVLVQRYRKIKNAGDGGACSSAVTVIAPPQDHSEQNQVKH
jgi:hypothetical protein